MKAKESVNEAESFLHRMVEQVVRFEKAQQPG